MVDHTSQLFMICGVCAVTFSWLGCGFEHGYVGWRYRLSNLRLVCFFDIFLIICHPPTFWLFCDFSMVDHTPQLFMICGVCAVMFFLGLGAGLNMVMSDGANAYPTYVWCAFYF